MLNAVEKSISINYILVCRHVENIERRWKERQRDPNS